MKLYSSIFLFFLATILVPAQNNPPFQQKQYETWADSVMQKLTPDERIGQLFMVAAYSDTNHPKNEEEVTNLIEEQKIGGLIFFKGGPVKQAELTNNYQALSKVPLLIGMDAEWGLAMRLDSVPRFPFQMALGAMNNDSLVYQMGAEIARECKRLGVQENFAPVVDINDNPENPVIGMRSFGENKIRVADMGLAYMKGLQDEHVLACGKHFPGHGDTKTDSHFSLPVVDYPVIRLDTLELYPFIQLFKNGLGSIMVAHLYIPSLDSTKNRASTLSPRIVDTLLKQQMGFNGLIYTDALNMQGVAKYYAPGIADVKALLAGNDVLLFSQDVHKAIEEIKKAMKKKEITQEEIDARCRKILMAKAWAGLNHYKPIVLANLVKDLNTKQADILNRTFAKRTITLLSNNSQLLPLKRLDTLRIASLVIGDSVVDAFQSRMNDYASVTHFDVPFNITDSVIGLIYNKLKSFNLIIVGVNHTRLHPADTFGITRAAIKMLDTVVHNYPTVLTFFSDPYILDYLPSVRKARALIMSYQDTPYTEDYSAQMIFGGIGVNGKLPVTASAFYQRGYGLITRPIRFEYTAPEDAGINSAKLAGIDSLAKYGMQQHAYPGCVVLVAKDGKVIYEKAFGYQNYNDTNHVKVNDVYDLASITKIAATTPAFMKMYYQNKMLLGVTLPVLMPKAAKTNKKKIIMENVLTHEAGLQPSIFFWKETMSGKNLRKGVYSSDSSAQYPYPVAAHMFIRKDYRDTMINEILKSPVDKKPVYKYSDIGFILLGNIIGNINGIPFDAYVQNNFYKPLGLQTMGFHPLYRIPRSRIIPTEYDSVFRKQLLRGYVHDQSAAMLGGVAGNAGLFSDANDLAVLMQMYLNYGKYGGTRYLDSATVKLFTSCVYCDKGNRRGLGFDKPETDTTKESPACPSASAESFGHYGFTGTYTWVDPKYHLVYVFLSNRVASGSDDNKLAKLSIRTKIAEIVYKSLVVSR
ncbi:MAG: glycoside hydrolase family 3 N-terminal domain-containing protein [Bacteroidia bacterium]